MATMVIDRHTLPETVSYCFFTPRVAVTRQRSGDVVLSPVINPEDFDNETDYLNAIPGMRESILAGLNAPDSEFEDVPDDWIDDDV